MPEMHQRTEFICLTVHNVGEEAEGARRDAGGRTLLGASSGPKARRRARRRRPTKLNPRSRLREKSRPRNLRSRPVAPNAGTSVAAVGVVEGGVEPRAAAA